MYLPLITNGLLASFRKSSACSILALHKTNHLLASLYKITAPLLSPCSETESTSLFSVAIHYSPFPRREPKGDGHRWAVFFDYRFGTTVELSRRKPPCPIFLRRSQFVPSP